MTSGNLCDAAVTAEVSVMSFRELFGDRFSYQRRSRFKTRLGRYKSDLCLATIVQGFASKGNKIRLRD